MLAIVFTLRLSSANFQIDDVRVYGHPLSSTDISNLYTAGLQ